MSQVNLPTARAVIGTCRRNVCAIISRSHSYVVTARERGNHNMKSRLQTATKPQELEREECLRSIRHHETVNDIKQCMIRLKRMVPAVRGQTKVNKLELLQHVIDYIQDLEVTLEEPEKVPITNSC